jgi:hypothetical protein
VFSSESQLSRVCRAFCARARLSQLWTEEGPTTQARDLAEHSGGPLSCGERLLLLVAWSLWSACSHVFYNLDGTSLVMLGKLMIAAGQGGGAAIDAWLVEAEKVIQQRKVGVGRA